MEILYPPISYIQIDIGYSENPISYILYPGLSHVLYPISYIKTDIGYRHRNRIPNQYKITQPGNQPATSQPASQPEYSKYNAHGKYRDTDPQQHTGLMARYAVHEYGCLRLVFGSVCLGLVTVG